mgnify:CR=1 FL=1
MQNITRTFYCDVAVIGGGVGGCAAAIEAARKGLHVILFEKGCSLGGLATNGYVPQIAGNIEGICLEFAKRLDSIGQLRQVVAGPYYAVPKAKGLGKKYYRNPSFEPEYGKLVLEDMVFEAGARVMYDSTLIDTVVEDSRITKAIFFTKGGYVAAEAKLYIDSTGDGDLAALSGVPFEVGGQDFAGLNISSTLGSRWAGADLIKYQKAEDDYKAEQIAAGVENPEMLINKLQKEAIAKGELARRVGGPFGFFRVIIPNTPMDNAEFVTFAFHAYYCHNCDSEDITRQILEQHQLMKQFHAFLRKYVPGFENVRLTGLGSLPGARDSRRIFGEYMLKAEDVVCGNKFEDGIARYPEVFDAHHPTSDEKVFLRHVHLTKPSGSAVCEDTHIGHCCDAQMHPFGVPAGVPARTNPRDYCDIPYRSLVPEKIDNLLCAGRCCSAEFHATGGMRIIGPAMGTGHAAGMAAYVAVTEKLRPRDIDGKRIRQMLIDEGVPLDQAPDGYWAEVAATKGRIFINPGDIAVILADEDQD